MDFNQLIHQFQAQMLSKGIIPPKDIIGDGQLHRFHIQGDKLNSKNGWYVLYIDGIAWGVFGSWKTGVRSKWSAKEEQFMNWHEMEKQNNKIKSACQQRDIIKTEDEQKAAEQADLRWHHCTKADPYHPYLIRKMIRPFYARQARSCLVLPVIDFEGKLWSLQYIDEDGSKKFLNHGAMKGHYIPVQRQPASGLKILITEGFSTAATLAQAYPENCVLAACNAGNLQPVAVAVRQRFPESEIMICCDDDRNKLVNTGLIKGRSAAIAARALLTKPEWPAEAPHDLTDFNDLACWRLQHEQV